MSFTSGLVKGRSSSSSANLIKTKGRATSRRTRARATAVWVAAGAAGLSLWTAQTARAAAANTTGTYTNTATGGGWATGANWSTTPDYPSGTNAGAIITSNQAANRSILVDTAVVLQSLSVQNDVTFTNSIATGTGGSLTFDGGGNGVSINVSGTGAGNVTISQSSAFNDNITAVVAQATATSAAGALNWTGAVSGGSGGFTKQGPGTLTFGTAAKQYTGPTVLDTDSGRTRISVAGSPTKTSSFTVKSGAQITMTGANGTTTWGTGSLFLNGTGIAAFPGVIRNDTNFAYTIGNPVVLQTDSLIHVQGSATGLTTLSGGVSGSGGLTLTAPGSDANIGMLALTGPGSYTGATVINAGTLRLASTTGAAAGGTSSITAHTNSFGARGFIQIEANNQINNAATITLDSATFTTLGNSEGSFDGAGKGVAGVGALTVSGNSDVDLGSGNSIVAFANSRLSAWSGTLRVLNWTGNADTGGGTDRLFFGSDLTGLTPAQLAQITFFSDAGTTPVGASAAMLSTGEVVPVVNGVPEPASLALVGLGAAGLLTRRRKR